MSRNTLISYLATGSDCDPFGDKHTEQISNASNFVPFQKERNNIGKLVAIDLKGNQQRRQKQIKLSKMGSMRSSIAPYLEMPQPPKAKTEATEMQFDPLTNYITLLTGTSQDEQKEINFGSYHKRLSQVERASKSNQNISMNRQKHHSKFALISKVSKDLTTQIPALGIYNPNFECSSKHQPNIIIRSKPNLSPITTPSKELLVLKVEKPKSNNEFEMMFARQLNQINREVDFEIRRNPNQLLRPYKELDLEPEMDLQEAEGLRSRMKHHFQSMKDSLNRIKGMINIKR